MSLGDDFLTPVSTPSWTPDGTDSPIPSIPARSVSGPCYSVPRHFSRRIAPSPVGLMDAPMPRVDDIPTLMGSADRSDRLLGLACLLAHHEEVSDREEAAYWTLAYAPSPDPDIVVNGPGSPDREPSSADPSDVISPKVPGPRLRCASEVHRLRLTNLPDPDESRRQWGPCPPPHRPAHPPPPRPTLSPCPPLPNPFRPWQTPLSPPTLLHPTFSEAASVSATFDTPHRARCRRLTLARSPLPAIQGNPLKALCALRSSQTPLQEPDCVRPHFGRFPTSPAVKSPMRSPQPPTRSSVGVSKMNPRRW